MSTDTTAVAELDPPMTIAEVDDLVQTDLGVRRGKRDGGTPPTPERDDDEDDVDQADDEDEASDETALALAHDDTVVATEDAERLALQALVPWEILPKNAAWNQRGKIDQWADDWGDYPRVYRAYSRAEWIQAIATLAAAVGGLATTHPEYQRTTGLYVEEHAEDLLVVRAKAWQLVIQVPAKSSKAGKTFKLENVAGHYGYGYGGTSKSPTDSFAELLTDYVTDAHRDVLLDLCCQYLREVRIRVNKAAWGAQHPDLAHLLDPQR